MPKVDVISKISDPDLGVSEFTFTVDGKAYKVTPKTDRGYDRMDDFMRYVYMSKRRGLSPFTYRNKDLFNIDREGGPEGSPKPKPPKLPTAKPEAIQEELKLSHHLDKISNQLEAAGLIKEAYKLDIIANTLEDLWSTNKATLFFDEMANEEIKPEQAKKIVEAYENGADTEHSVASITGIDAWTCKKVLDIAHKHDLLNQGVDDASMES